MGKMKKRTISTLKAIFGSKKGKRHHSSKSSRSVTPDPPTPNTPSSVESFRPIPRTPPPARVGPPPSPPVPTRPIAPVAPEPSGPVRLIPCAVCGRTFVPESLAKHVKICEKTAAKKRKTFDSSRQRREGLPAANGVNTGTDLEQYLPKNFGLPENSPFLEKSPPNTAKAAPKAKPQSVRTTVMKPAADLQKCPHCSRAFGVRAFERHVEWCADKAKILPAAPVQPPHITDAKQRLNARTKYKAPLARGRRSSQSRDKSSQSRSASVESSRGASPPPPRDCGDGRRRARASESMSSNDCNDEPSPHVPVIRNTRNSQNNSSGDANVKARQARLARDLSSSRKEPNLPKIQQEITDPNPKKPQNKIKHPGIIKKEQKLKKLEEIANKYNEQQAKAAEEKEEENKKRKEKRQIPILKRVVNKNVKPKNEITEPIEKSEPSKVTQKPVRKPNAKAKPTILKSAEVTQTDRNKEKNTKNKTRRDTVSLPKENSMSVDSLDDCVTINPAGNTKFSQTVGINTELFCVPCVIHENVDVKSQSCNNKNRITLVESARKAKNNVTDNTVELLYKNSTIDSSYNTQATTSSTTTTINKSDNYTPEILNDACKVEKDEVDESDNYFSVNFLSKSEPIDSLKVLEDDENGKEMFDLSGDHFEDSFEHGSGDNLDNSDGTKYEEENNTENNQSGRRHGSGDTYTKFTQNPGDLDEFMHLTDEMINSQNQMELDLAEHIDNLHTPRTVSLETLNDKNLDNADDSDKKKQFSDTFEDLKLDLKQLLQRAGDTVRNTAKQTDRQSDRKENQDVSDMEHITVYGLKYYEQQQNKKNSSDDEDSTLKLPSITVTNKPEPKVACTKKRMQKIFKSNRKYILLREQSRDNADNRTFIVAENVRDSDDQSISTEAPPLKLPRIESASSNNVVSENLFPSSVKRSTSLLDSIHKKVSKTESGNTRHKSDQLEQDIMQSLKEFDKFYESEKNQMNQSNKDVINYNAYVHNGTEKESRSKTQRKSAKSESHSNGNYTPNGKSSNDSAYSSLNRISPSKLTVCPKESNGPSSLERIPAGSDSSGSPKDEIRSVSSEEFLAMERSAELDEPIPPPEHAPYKEVENQGHEKRVSSRASSRRGSWRPRAELSSSSSEVSLHKAPARLSRFCHECGSRFPVDTAKFCIECGVKRLAV
ncbi:probable serine/threonine-protein kinase tsuA isoform X2 [Cydia pomonella]|uniref:probable serine/threonine-protein kinase tsuA isoform X2 n=1 Tax=Cydia pomonella TaxID=82600 RepID=UPI002ADE6D5E|nr:probable serine/threonine-protein kinase tsuA isoform X2 [Cydia pomonella]